VEETKLSAAFAIGIGLLMLGQWAFLITSGQVPELQTEPIRIGFHLTGEAATAACLVVGGAGLWTRRSWGRSVFLVAAGMLLYTSIVSPGYFAQQGDWALVVMFVAIVVATLVSLRTVWS